MNRAELMAEIAKVEEFSTALIFLSDPDEVLKKVGLSRSSLRVLEFDSEVSAHLETRLASVKTVPWRLEPGEGTVSDFCYEQLEPWIDGIIGHVWRAVMYGYSVTHVAYSQLPGGQFGWGNITDRPIRAFRPQRDGSLQYNGIGGWQAIKPEYLNTKLFLALRSPTYDQPQGEALLSRIYWPWFFKSQGYRFWARWLERMAGGLTVGTGFNDPAAAAAALYQAVQSAVVTLETGQDVKTTHPPSHGEAYGLFDAAMNRAIQKVILGRSATGDQSSGSFAAQKTDDEVRDDRKYADVRLIQPVIQRMINALVSLNFPAGESPMFVMADSVGLEETRADRDTKLYSLGVRFTEQYLMDRYDFEEGDFTVVDPSAVLPAQFSTSNVPALRFTDTPEQRQFTEAQQAVETIIAAADRRAPEPIPADGLKAAIINATDEADLYQRVAQVIDEDDEGFQSALEQALAVAQVLGYVASNQGLE